MFDWACAMVEKIYESSFAKLIEIMKVLDSKMRTDIFDEGRL